MRGNVKICLMHLDEGYFDVLTAAVSELHRVDQSDQITEVLSPEAMCPPIGAGIIAL
nr:Porphobilinogen deaminase [Kibdelosporangium sp. MJ126-NF4]